MLKTIIRLIPPPAGHETPHLCKPQQAGRVGEIKGLISLAINTEIQQKLSITTNCFFFCFKGECKWQHLGGAIALGEQHGTCRDEPGVAKDTITTPQCNVLSSWARCKGDGLRKGIHLCLARTKWKLPRKCLFLTHNLLDVSELSPEWINAPNCELSTLSFAPVSHDSTACETWELLKMTEEGTPCRSSHRLRTSLMTCYCFYVL